MNIYFKIEAHHQIWWCDQLKGITAQVNKELGTKFNTILLNKYKDGNDCIGFHRDRETSWAANSGFATLALEQSAIFKLRMNARLHKNGQVLYLLAPMNAENLHSVPKRKKVTECRISLTFREIV